MIEMNSEVQVNYKLLSYFQVDTFPLNERTLKGRIEIDPATAGDAGIYTCMAHNEYAVFVKNFQTNYGF